MVSVMISDSCVQKLMYRDGHKPNFEFVEKRVQVWPPEECVQRVVKILISKHSPAVKITKPLDNGSSCNCPFELWALSDSICTVMTEEARLLLRFSA